MVSAGFFKWLKRDEQLMRIQDNRIEPWTAVVAGTGRPHDRLNAVPADWKSLGLEKVIVVAPEALEPSADHDRAGITWRTLATALPFSGSAWRAVCEEVTTPTALILFGDSSPTVAMPDLRRLLSVATDTGASLVYGHYRETRPDGTPRDRATIDCQLGSVRDDFDFGPVVAINMAAAGRSLARFGPLSDSDVGGWYELRLRLSLESPPLRIPEVLSACVSRDGRASGVRQFDYVDPRYETAQRQLEGVATAHLERLGARLTGPFRAVPPPDGVFPVEASVVIPVRNRAATIGDAVRSAVEQVTDFPFNVIVVDNHSTDRTGQVLEELAAAHANVIRLVPVAAGLWIGGCWNLAVADPRCGRYAVQLDSDDLYAGPDTLQRMVDALRAGPCAMAVGAYRLVDFELNELPPGVVDHREWTRDNGRNNLLRVNGIGAPRAFDTRVLRAYPFPNVNYGEDYAAGLRLSREYEVARIYDPIYLCRRWEGNSDADLPPEVVNGHNAYKDRMRTLEILGRQRLDRAGTE